MLTLLLAACTHHVDITADGTHQGPIGDPDATTAVVTGTGTTDTDTTTTTEPDQAEIDAAYEAFYAFDSMHEVRFTLTQAAIDAMNADVRAAQRGDLSFDWQRGDVEIDGVSYADVAVRIKGSSTLQNFSGKPSLKIKFNEYVTGRKFAGMERVTLNNNVEDPSQAKQVMVYHLNNEGGRRASRASNAEVYVNGELYGLYTNVEVMDDHWLARRYDDPSGDLWEANDYAEFSQQGLQYWELASGDGTSVALDAVATELANRGGDLYTRLDAVCDMDDFLHFWAWRVMVGDFDGYPMNLNDVYVYVDPSDGRLDFMPWGVDEAWYSAAPESWSSASGQLAAKCLRDATCMAAYTAAMEDVVTTYEGLPVLDDADALFAATDAALAEDPRGTGYAQAATARSSLRRMLEVFPQRIRDAAGF